MDFFRVIQEQGDSDGNQTVNVVESTLPTQLDSEAFDTLNESLLEVFSRQSNALWVIDLTGLSYMGSSALGLMVNIRQRVKDAEGKLALCGLSPHLLRAFQTCCLERLFTIRTARPDAIRAVMR